MKDKKPTPALEVKEDGQIWLIPILPDKPDYLHDNKLWNTVRQQEYNQALASTDRILCADQSAAGQVIINNHLSRGVPPTFQYIGDLAVGIAPDIYPIPDLKWEIDVPNHPDCGVKGGSCSMHCHSVCEKLDEPQLFAVISIPESKNYKEDYDNGFSISPKIPERAQHCTLPDEELIKRCGDWVSKLCHSGGNAWCLRVPVDFDHDPDMLFIELINRYKQTLNEKRT